MITSGDTSASTGDISTRDISMGEATMPGRVRMPYSCGDLDRAGAYRTDSEWFATALRDPATRIIPMWRDKCLVALGSVVSMGDAPPPEIESPVFLGLDGLGSNQANGSAIRRDNGLESRPDGPLGVFALDLSALDLDAALAVAAATDAVDVRQLVASLDPAEASTLAYARGMLHWHRNQRFCGACGSRAESRDGGHVRACGNEACGRLLFPRIEPAVIMLIEAPAQPGEEARCLLGRHRGAAGFSTLAGFVEIGESLEGAVRREAFEEAGVRIGDVAYQGSQAWPFPSGIMIGFRARSLDADIAVDHNELDDARWFTRAEVRALADPKRRPDSIESFLLDTWVRAGG